MLGALRKIAKARKRRERRRRRMRRKWGGGETEKEEIKKFVCNELESHSKDFNFFVIFKKFKNFKKFFKKITLKTVVISTFLGSVN